MSRNGHGLRFIGMRTLCLIVGLLWTPQAKPFNATCPVKGGMASKPTITTTFQGYTIGFC